MAEQNQQKRGQNIFEEDMKRLAEQVVEMKKSQEAKNYSDKDLIKKTLRPTTYLNNKPNKQSEDDNKKQPVVEQEEKFLPDYLKGASPEIKLEVERLLQETINNGLVKGVSEAQKAEPFILDAYRDALVDKLHDEFVRRKLL